MKFILCKLINSKVVPFGKTFDEQIAHQWRNLNSTCIAIAVKPA